jgi:transcriptional regulator with XRE-family HTH domain
MWVSRADGDFVLFHTLTPKSHRPQVTGSAGAAVVAGRERPGMPQPLTVSRAIRPAIRPAIHGAIDFSIGPANRGSEDPEVDPVLDPVDPELVKQLTRALNCGISATIRAGRADLKVSQRELADLTGLSQSVIARLEAGTSDPRLSCLVAVLTTIGARLSLPDRATPTRMAGEYARDEAGRRLPAHLGPYRLREPHIWWSGIMDIRRWPFEPKWSYRRRPGWRD